MRRFYAKNCRLIVLFYFCLVVFSPATSQDEDHTAIDTLMIIVRPGDSLLRIAKRMLSLTPYYTAEEFIEEVRRSNGLDHDMLHPGEKLHIPIQQKKLLNETVPKPSTFTARGIYLNAKVAARADFRVLVDSLVYVGGNTVVFDLKDRRGNLSYRSTVDLAERINATSIAPITRPEIFIRMLHEREVHIIGRLTCFYDSRLAQARPDWTPHSRQSGEPWYENDQPAWVDPSRSEVQDYLLELVTEAVAMGVDEIQLDYVRFPTEGNLGDARYHLVSDEYPKHRVITGFVQRVREQLAFTGVLLSADIFGVAVWGRAVDEAVTGQRLVDLVNHLDIVSPMLYPSHFYGSFAQIANPVAYPYYLVYLGCRQMQPLMKDDKIVVRPWLQAFNYRVKDFTADYIREQMHGAVDGGATGWLLWNSSGYYTKGLQATDDFMNNAAWSDSTRLHQVPTGKYLPK